MYRKISEEHNNGEERTSTVDEPGALSFQTHRKGLWRRGMKEFGTIIAAVGGKVEMLGAEREYIWIL